MFDIQYFQDYEVKYNTRLKYYVNKNGVVHLLEKMYCNRYIFNPDNVEFSDNTKRNIQREKWNKELDEMYGVSGQVDLLCKENPVERSKRRASKNIKDLILCNDFDLFCTLTLNPELIDNKDYKAVIKKLNTYLDNRVRRKDLKYVGVPELHIKGGLHFHFLCNSESMSLIDSGTVSVMGHKRPIKISTADRLHISLEDRKTVYNIDDWGLGFTTAIKTYGNSKAVANYIGKYITKADDKIGGRWYYSGGNLTRPLYKYDRIDFNNVDTFDYDFECVGGKFKVVTYEN